MRGASGAAPAAMQRGEGEGEGEWPGGREPDAFHIRDKLILSHFLRNRAQASFRPSPLP